MEHQELYSYMESIVKRYFKFYRLRYLNASIEFEDLIQEAYMVTALLLKKIKIVGKKLVILMKKNKQEKYPKQLEQIFVNIY